MKKILILYFIAGLTTVMSPVRSDDIDKAKELKVYQETIGSRTIGISNLLKAEAEGVKQLTENFPKESKISPEKLLNKTLGNSPNGEGSILVLQTLNNLGLTGDDNKPSKTQLSVENTSYVIDRIGSEAMILYNAADELDSTAPKIYGATVPEQINDIINNDCILPPIAQNVLNAPPTNQISAGVYTNNIAKATDSEPCRTQVIAKDPFTTDFAAVTLLNIPNVGICSGTLIHKKAIITSAHCFCNQYENRDLIYDSTLCSAKVLNVSALHEDKMLFAFFQQEGLLPIDKVTLHPAYNYKDYKMESDLAILELKNDLNNIEPAEVSTQDLPKNKPIDSTVVGFGLGVSTNLETSQFPIGLKGTVVKRFIRADQDHLIASYKSSGQEQIAKVDPISGQCEGDSGGPIIEGQGYDGSKLIGVITSGAIVGCNPENDGKDENGNILSMKDVYLDDNKVKWINDTLPKSSSASSGLTIPIKIKKAQPFRDSSIDRIPSDKHATFDGNSSSTKGSLSVKFKPKDKYITIAANASLGKTTGYNDEGTPIFELSNPPIRLSVTDKNNTEMCPDNKKPAALCTIQGGTVGQIYKLNVIAGQQGVEYQLVTTHFESP